MIVKEAADGLNIPCGFFCVKMVTEIVGTLLNNLIKISTKPVLNFGLSRMIITDTVLRKYLE